MLDPNPEEIDLAQVVRELGPALAEYERSGFVRGRSAIRDWVARRFGASEAFAERLVDTMVARGFLRFERDLSGENEGVWRTSGGAY